jgi:ABC-type bacteriocin/lantibiotic exporter with double-glycine peptidase domain
VRAIRIGLVVLLTLAQCVSVQTIHVRQRGASDCAVAVLAMTTGKPYEVVDKARLALGIELGSVGMYEPDVIRTAAALGVTLVRVKTFDPMTDAGVLFVVLPNTVTHAAYLDGKGDVYDPNERWPQAWAIARSTWSRVLFLLKKS